MGGLDEEKRKDEGLREKAPAAGGGWKNAREALGAS